MPLSEPAKGVALSLIVNWKHFVCFQRLVMLCFRRVVALFP
jgi:hypothetical protein